MDFIQRFNDVSCDTTHVSSLEIGARYPIEFVERVTTRYGETVLMSVKDPNTLILYKVFLPQRYASRLRDEDLKTINEAVAVYHLVNKGLCKSKNAYLLAIE